MRVLLVTNGYPPTAFGGVEVYTRDVATALASQGHQISVFCRDSDQEIPDYTIREEILDSVRVIRVVNDFKTIDSFAQSYQDEHIEKLFDELLRREKPEVVHFNHLIALSKGLPVVASSHGIRHLTTLHDYWDICHRVRLQDWRERRCPGPMEGGDCYRCVVASARWIVLRRSVFRFGKSLLSTSAREQIRERGLMPRAISVPVMTGRRADFDRRLACFNEALRLSHHVLTPSEHVKQVFRLNGFLDLPIEVLPLGIRLPDTTEIPRRNRGSSEKINIGFSGTLIPDKGTHVLLKAFRSVDSDLLRLHIYGKDDADLVYTKRLQEVADGDGRITFHGPFTQETRDHVYQSMDVLIIPSLFQETFSLVAREALLNGTPVIASRVGALPEIIIHGVNGYLFSPGDAGELAGILNELDRQPERLRELDIPGPVPIISKEEHAEALLRIYQELR